MVKTQKLNDDELTQINGGISVSDGNGGICDLVVGDVIEIINYMNMDGRYCLLKIEASGTYRFLEYSTEPYPDKGISFSKIPTGAIITKVGHDQQFVNKNLVCGMVI